MTSKPSRRGFLVRTLVAGAAVLLRRVGSLVGGLGRPLTAAGAARAAAAAPPHVAGTLTHGPLLGHLTSSHVRVWARCAEPGAYQLALIGEGGERVASEEASEERDRTVVWDVTGLAPGTRYRYEVRKDARTILSRPDLAFTTPLPQEAPSVIRLAVGSCAREQEGDRAVWLRMASLDPHAVVLLGDTPYIDSTDLTVQRTRYGEFVAVQEFADLLRSHPLYATWDDHDFGRNDTDGMLDGKENARQAFVEYHANPSYGHENEGIYTSFRMGGIEVFLLDTRWFAGTGRSPIADGPTMLGARQWEWLRDGLRASDAPFKLLASGLIWNGAVRPGKPDHWDSYPAEKEALLRFLGEERISGVVLAGGDIHRTRVLRYPTEEVVGYALTELVTSPIHAGVIVEANAPHPALVFDSGTPHSFMLLTVDTTVEPATMHASFQDAAGSELYALTLTAAELTRL
jgi:alkaline phosphatase D